MKALPTITAILHLFLPLSLFAQSVGWIEDFEAAEIPQLPMGWVSSRSGPTGDADASTTHSIPHSGLHAVTFANAGRSQWIASPSIANTFGNAVQLEFYDRRSATFTSDVIIQWSADSDTAYSGDADTLRAVTSNAYVRQCIRHLFVRKPNEMRIRWMIRGNGAGSTGTYRIDDIRLGPEYFPEIRTRWISVTPPSPRSGEQIRLRGCVENTGTAAADSIPVVLVRDADDDSLLSAGEIVATTVLSHLAPSDSCILEFELGPLQPRRYRYCLVYSVPAGTSEPGDPGWYEFAVHPGPHSVVINEIMFAPLPGMPEYVELHNTSDDDIEIGEWIVADAASIAAGKNRGIRLPRTAIIPAKGYFVIASDSSIFTFFTMDGNRLFIPGKAGLSLNNDGDIVRISDAGGWCVDSVRYFASWHHPGRTNTAGISLERIDPHGESIDPHNWISSADEEGGTPGRLNSMHLPLARTGTQLSISPNPFSPDGDMIDDVVTISAQFPMRLATVRMRIYDPMGRLVRTLLSAEPAGSVCTAAWDGCDEGKRRCRIGIYILLIEAIDVESGARITRKDIITLAGKL